MHPYTDSEWKILPNTILTLDVDWDPTILNSPADEDIWLDPKTDFDEGPDSTLFNEFRDYSRRVEIRKETLNYFRTKYHYFNKEIVTYISYHSLEINSAPCFYQIIIRLKRHF